MCFKDDGFSMDFHCERGRLVWKRSVRFAALHAEKKQKENLGRALSMALHVDLMSAYVAY